ncbi:MAG: nucleotide exchange factor GrpE [Candidatus Paceibacterota bacterium]|jgi:molecular chaperone GrpE
MKKDGTNDDIIYEEEGHEKSDDLVASKKTSKKQVDDVVMDDENEAPEALVKKLKEKIKGLEKEKQEYMDGWQRERADFINYKKRVENEKIEVVKYANEGLLEEITQVLDSFEMAFSNKEAWEKVDKNWRVGVEYIHTQLVKILDENNFRATNPIGEKFDPKFHIAVEHIETDDEKKDGIITEVKKKGYILNDRVMKAAQVVVAEYKK